MSSLHSFNHIQAFPTLRSYDEHRADALGVALFAKSKVYVPEEAN